MPTLSIDIAARLATFQDSLDKIGRQGEQLSGRLNKAFGTVKSSIAALGVGLTGGAFAAFVKTGIDAADNLGKLSQQIGVSTESLSALNYAASLSGTSAEQLSQAMVKLAKAATDTAAGTGEALVAFKALGVSVKDAAGNLRGTEDLLLELADRFSKIEDGTGKTAIAMRLFGESGARLIPFLNQGRSGIEQLRQEAERLGIILSSKTAKAAEQFNDNMTRLGKSFEGLKVTLANDTLPFLNRLVDDLVKGAEVAGGFGKALVLLSGINPFKDISSNIRTLNSDLDGLLDRQARALRQGRSGAASGFTGAIEDTRKQIEFLKYQQRRDVMAQFSGEEFYDARDMRRLQRNQLENAPTLPPTSTGPDQGLQFIETLRKRLLAIEQDEYAVLRLEAAQKKVLASAEPLIQALQRQTEFQKQHAEAVQRDAAAQEAEQQRRFALVDGVAKYVEGLEEETALQKLSNEQRLITVQLLRLEQAGISSTSDEFAAAAERIRAAVNAAAGAQVVESLKGPLERARDEVTRLNDLFAAGAIDVDTYRSAVEKLGEEFRKAKDAGKSTTDVAKEIGLTFSSAFEDAISGGKGFRDILKGIEQDLLKLGTRKLITEPLLEAFTGFLQPSGGGGGGGAASFLGSLFSSIFGGAMADGGSVEPGRGYLVGERGPEWFMPRTAGNIIPNGGGSMTVINNFRIEGGSVTPQSRSQIAAAALRGIEQGRRNL